MWISLLYNNYIFDDLETTLQSNFQAGVNSVYNAVVAKGVTPASTSLSDIVTGIENISTGVIDLGSGTSFNVSSYSGYENFTVNNFVILDIPSVTSNSKSYKGYSSSGNIPQPVSVQGFITGITKSYNSSTGVLSYYITYGTKGSYWNGGASASYNNPYTAPVKAGLIL